MLKEVGCGSSTPPGGDCTTPSRRENINESDKVHSEVVGGAGGLACGGCGRDIAERWYLRAADRAWHCGCLRCCHCRVPLAAELTCFSRDGNIYCKEDYYRLFAVSRCSRCRAGISATELVMRARELVYHVACFVCASCGVPLNKGDHFGQRDGLVYCRPHYELICCAADYGNTAGSVEDLGSPDVSSLTGYYSANEQSPVANVQKGRPRKRKLSEISRSDLPVSMRLAAELMHPNELSSSMESLAAYDTSVGSPGPIHQSQRTKRMRTSFKHHQLRTMKSYFAINQNPDAKDLKQLAQKTGLSKRVLQVWFQNARAKWRRNIMRQEGSGGINVGGNANGTGCPGTPVPSSTGNSPNIGPGGGFLGADSNSQPGTSMEEIHALHHLHSAVSSQVSFSDLY
ncbi:GSCOCG00005217001-RA-CDS [Cotesia congregata]|uniref:Similar to LHX9: LIM/homeobox protein Lhx9 (Bos taurus) n=1 Tax=Cotesia congregata TaxID=51543 RepID=A0A8J2HN60_COTCN|nr:GSCOCG00005217001-RA-CDS [Cotesia congregata]CAG5101872.1 Similar to LHX9: LIM/homeobox protein Lhx9 (Bos taurus) [Cotesia congregata]